MTQLASLPQYDADIAALRRVLSYFPSGVVAVLAEVDGTPHGLVASSFTTGVSWEPPLVSCAVQRTSTTWPRLRGLPRIGVSVLAADQAGLTHRIASRDRDRRFDGVPLRSTGSSARFIAGAPVWFECSIHAEVDAGDHVVVLFEIHALGADPSLEPLVLHGPEFRALEVREQRSA